MFHIRKQISWNRCCLRSLLKIAIVLTDSVLSEFWRYYCYYHPVDWGCRIRRLHFCWGVKHLRYETTCWSGNQSGQVISSIPLCVLLDYMGRQRGPIRSNDWSYQSLSLILLSRPYSSNCSCDKQVPNPIVS